ncbi:hypothetical protein BDN67DRAFT_573168 [Paxillus ammoniavirescens]|nr:hypothetical protein BDN67DRAFT_573168 [Paxillus ammoniavirescens]
MTIVALVFNFLPTSRHQISIMRLLEGPRLLITQILSPSHHRNMGFNSLRFSQYNISYPTHLLGDNSPFQIAYMQGSGTHGSMSTQHLQHCQSCQLLDAQASKLRAERDIIRSMYQNLLIETQSAPKAESVVHPTPLTHPKVRFWKQSQFNTFVLSPEGAVAKLGSSPYLETEDGEPIGYESIKAIRQTLRGAWTKLANQGKAPQTWGMLSVSRSELFNLLMETAYPLFKLVDDGWKLKRFATQAYPAWRAIHLDEDCRLLLKGKKAIKMEVDENAVSGQKRKGDKSLPKTSGKRFKGEENSPGPSLSTQPAPVVPNSKFHGLCCLF